MQKITIRPIRWHEPRPVCESALLAAPPRPHEEPLALLGDNAREQLFVVLRDKTRTQLRELEAAANEKIRGLGLLGAGGVPLSAEEFRCGVEIVVGEFREGRERVYNQMAWEHGKMQANIVWDALNAGDLLPSEYLRIREETIDSSPSETDSDLPALEDVSETEWDVVSCGDSATRDAAEGEGKDHDLDCDAVEMVAGSGKEGFREVKVWELPGL